MKFAILPKKIPIGAEQATKSDKTNNFILFFLEKNIIEIITPIKPP